ncbi:Formate dehydrogenase [Populus alba x Populus x berolinensis]|uniref:Formate dehydrogenase n=1 Tax=Populus alba x Populus x berolinensis TaxID=444605 RepID=A0AAD6RHY2_9ROSI|nr:Formate dehydrogenase [Populus alba x Populus x berolinensis]KAJ7008517.1 Formate dehydrogenase [Populus alba x Populus x berolinensis]
MTKNGRNVDIKCFPLFNVVSVTEDELMRILVLVSNFLPGYHQVINEWNVAISAYRAYNLEGKKVGTVGAGRIRSLSIAL